ncbi:hypothetical protein BDV96DRAFT_647967 [Lophiotrema nucula]|uniref:Uncharacterized protein n=1 Tax=Lophiotrema nucula TaxID=690887 RepID=A0A6A5Z2T3_9PLEO|nr:hypothetical protein BDV96DRAFT_647967 [Lophiotrema nucula]
MVCNCSKSERNIQEMIQLAGLASRDVDFALGQMRTDIERINRGMMLGSVMTIEQAQEMWTTATQLRNTLLHHWTCDPSSTALWRRNLLQEYLLSKRDHAESGLADSLRLMSIHFAVPENCDAIIRVVYSNDSQVTRDFFSADMAPPVHATAVLQRLIDYPESERIPLHLAQTPNGIAQHLICPLRIPFASDMRYDACETSGMMKQVGQPYIMLCRDAWMIRYLQACTDIKIEYVLPPSCTCILYKIPCEVLKKVFEKMNGYSLSLGSPMKDSMKDIALFVIIGSSQPLLKDAIAAWVCTAHFLHPFQEWLQEYPRPGFVEQTALTLLVALCVLRIVGAASTFDIGVLSPIPDSVKLKRLGTRDLHASFRSMLLEAAKGLLKALGQVVVSSTFEVETTKKIKLLSDVIGEESSNVGAGEVIGEFDWTTHWKFHLVGTPPVGGFF